jgi:hypothetical protein
MVIQGKDLRNIKKLRNAGKVMNKKDQVLNKMHIKMAIHECLIRKINPEWTKFFRKI